MEEREKRKIIAEEKHKEWVQKKNEQVKRNANTCTFFTSLQCLSFALLCFPRFHRHLPSVLSSALCLLLLFL